MNIDLIYWLLPQTNGNNNAVTSAQRGHLHERLGRAADETLTNNAAPAQRQRAGYAPAAAADAAGPGPFAASAFELKFPFISMFQVEA